MRIYPSRYDLGLTNEQLFTLMQTLDKDENGRVDLQEFLERFQVTFDKVKEEKDAELQDAIREIGDILYKKKKDVAGAFALFDSEGEGKVNYEQFSKVLKKLGVSFDEVHRKTTG